jgi:hypothetical protein
MDRFYMIVSMDQLVAGVSIANPRQEKNRLRLILFFFNKKIIITFEVRKAEGFFKYAKNGFSNLLFQFF